MGDKEQQGTKGNDGRDVYRVKLDLSHKHDEWLREFRAGKKINRKIEFFDPELEEAVRPLVTKKRLIYMQGVKLKVGQNVPTHPHENQDVVIYMPMDHSSALLFQNPDIRFPTEAGWAVFIPAGQWHSVEMNNDSIDRYTIATLYR